jgi:hypothetical protein
MLRAPEDARQLVVDVLAEHAEDLLATARRHSLCADDAHDAYQLAVEIFLRRAGELEEDLAFRWLHTVVKHEAMRLRAQRLRLVGGEAAEMDDHEAWTLRTSDEHIASFDLMTRSAEALRALKPQERRALWLLAQGHSYAEIAEMTSWTYTKVNRCVTEGRRSFLRRYADIATGEECRRWEPVLSAMVDGEATAADVAGARPHLRHCPACRQRLRALHEGSAGMAAVFGVPALAAGGGEAGEPGLLARLFETLFGPVHDRFVASAAKLQSGLEAVMPAKVAVVAASAAAVGGGVAVEQAVVHRGHDRPAQSAPAAATPPPAASPVVARATPAPAAATPAKRTAAARRRAAARGRAARRRASRTTRRAAVRRTKRREFAVRESSSAHAGSSAAATAEREFTPAPAPPPATPAAHSAAAPAPIRAPANATKAERTAAAEFGG